MQYYCQCGERLKAVKFKGEKSKTANIHFKVLIVTTKTNYKCPKGCELKEVKVR